MSRTKQTASKALGGKAPRKGVSMKSIQSSGSSSVMAKRTRFKAGALALKEIRKYQKSTDLLIRKRPFQRMVRELCKGGEGIRFQASAIVAFQEAVENFLTNLMEDAYRCVLHAKRVTLMPKDICLVYKIKYANILYAALD
ncbi:core histone H2A/H2B/H3/H4-like protein [Encephalitozoon hellem]|uniref:Histone H3 n=1 Tax=Encephalitozoon hellem TaxID=27973 RepID=A0A9Q9CDJ4_ENCHE|nr:histone H3 [Encephalitozoon hellem ATCC 50504]AFM98940.1 histone H3 [Encephalitozoon hellem ATCC 50504]KAG5858770.1 core histone H2A/H2B/H3/H4-like protein [Encephalitozoon hellem]UTX43954.1 histone H3 [Encephalitozoon hellem]WEL39438.1 histone H3 [Encephalitozoon hellem]|eukprot:XP_003887921.1 histone H3 [Encephalitozoon hellem ATCC 50504]